LIATVILYFSWYGKTVYETFQNQESEGFVDLGLQALTITTCPASSMVYNNNKGQMVCCKGMVQTDKCIGETICSLSEKMTMIPTCTEWYKAYLLERGRGKCPVTMPNYFENSDVSVRGCTSGDLNKDGSGPLKPADPHCNIYNTQQEDDGNIDSCTNIKMLDSVVCFKNSNIATEKTLTSVLNGLLPVMVICKYGDKNTGNAGTCTTDESTVRFVKGIYDLIAKYTGKQMSISDWKNGSAGWDPIDKLTFCSVTEKYKINKTVAFMDLPKLKVF